MAPHAEVKSHPQMTVASATWEKPGSENVSLSGPSRAPLTWERLSVGPWVRMPHFRCGESSLHAFQKCPGWVLTQKAGLRPQERSVPAGHAVMEKHFFLDPALQANHTGECCELSISLSLAGEPVWLPALSGDLLSLLAKLWPGLVELPRGGHRWIEVGCEQTGAHSPLKNWQKEFTVNNEFIAIMFRLVVPRQKDKTASQC